VKPSDWDSFATGRTRQNSPCRSQGDAAIGDEGERLGVQLSAKIDLKYSWTQIWDDMFTGKVKGVFTFGMNSVQIELTAET
jgi:hypothetical protein